MRKLKALILATAMTVTLTACSKETPQQDDYDNNIVYVENFKTVTNDDIPEKYYTLCAAMMTQAFDDFERNGWNTEHFTFNWAVQEEGYLGMKTIALEFDANGHTETIAVIISNAVG